MRLFDPMVLLCLAIPFAHAQHTSVPHEPAPQRQTAPAPVSVEDAQALRLDLQRMKALVQQMQTNLAFVTNTQGPLKHQFELEIEMWQLEVSRLERRLGATSEDEPRK